MCSQRLPLALVIAGFLFTMLLAWSIIAGSISTVVTDPSGAVTSGAGVDALYEVPKVSITLVRGSFASSPTKSH